MKMKSAVEFLALSLLLSLFSIAMAQDLISMFGSFEHSLNGQDPDVGVPTPVLIKSKGYPVEEYFVTTSDGYILGIHRIPHGREGSDSKTKKPTVLLQHGLLSTSADFVLNYPHNSLGFILADLGYDVWMGNVRGNTYSTNHTTISTNDAKFWDFSWDEIAANDLPAIIDFVLEKTGDKKLHYAAHSLGTTIMFALLSENQSYRDKVHVFAAMAPVTKVTYTKSPIAVFHRTAFLLEPISGFVTTRGKLSYTNPIIQTYIKYTCGNVFTRTTICKALLFFFDGEGINHLNKSRMAVYFSHFPSSTSINTVLQFTQSIPANRFQKFDHGILANIPLPIKPKPDEYHLENVTVPVGLFSSTHDVFADPKDVDFVREKLPNIVKDFVVNTSDFTHADFVYGYDADIYVYNGIVELLNKYSGI